MSVTAIFPRDPDAHRQTATSSDPLSARERDVLELIATGRSNQEIADALYLSINTIKTYIRSAYGKIGVSSRSQAVIWVLCRHQEAASDPPTLRVVPSEESGA